MQISCSSQDSTPTQRCVWPKVSIVLSLRKLKILQRCIIFTIILFNATLPPTQAPHAQPLTDLNIQQRVSPFHSPRFEPGNRNTEIEELEVAPVLMEFTVSCLNHRKILAPEHEDGVNVMDLNGCGTSFILFYFIPLIGVYIFLRDSSLSFRMN